MNGHMNYESAGIDGRKQNLSTRADPDEKDAVSNESANRSGAVSLTESDPAGFATNGARLTDRSNKKLESSLFGNADGKGNASVLPREIASSDGQLSSQDSNEKRDFKKTARVFGTRVKSIIAKYALFIGPGFLISVSYMDPGNYSTDVAAGAEFRFSHLFVILLSNLFAIFLQSLCIRLGTVTGFNLAEICREHFPRWLNLLLYFLAELAIIATDIAEVIGSAIALNILIKLPLVAGVVVTTIDVLIVLFFYRPNGSMRGLRYFEIFVSVLVLAVLICFIIELAKIEDASVGEIFRGYLPSKSVASGDGLYLSCGILGATVMPHSLFLGSGIVQPRLREFDIREGHYIPTDAGDNETEAEVETERYKPSIPAIRYSMWYCIADLVISLFTCALFANSAILIVSGATLSDTPDAKDADLFSIHDLLSKNLSKVAGTIFCLALFFSGESAGVVVTLAGQMVSEGFLHWKIRPWVRRLVTRAIAITPCIIVAASVGRSGLSGVLNASQVALSIILPFVSAPLIYFTCKKEYMSVRVKPSNTDGHHVQPGAEETVDMSNNLFTTIIAVAIWLFIAMLNVYLVVTLAMGKD